MSLQDVARGRLHEDKLHQGCLANPPAPSSITLCRSLSPTHARSVSLHQVSHSSNTLPLFSSQWCSILLRLNGCVPQLLWVWHFEVKMKVFSLMLSIHSPYAKTQRGKNTPKTEYTFSDLGWLSWFAQTVSQSKKNRVFVFDTEDERLGGLECLTEKENSLSTETHVLPLFSQGKYLFLLLKSNCCH